MKQNSIASKVWCVSGRTREGSHRLRVTIADVREANNQGRGVVRAFCPRPHCPEHDQKSYVGLNRIPGLEKIIDA